MIDWLKLFLPRCGSVARSSCEPHNLSVIKREQKTSQKQNRTASCHRTRKTQQATQRDVLREELSGLLVDGEGAERGDAAHGDLAGQARNSRADVAKEVHLPRTKRERHNDRGVPSFFLFPSFRELVSEGEGKGKAGEKKKIKKAAQFGSRMRGSTLVLFSLFFLLFSRSVFENVRGLHKSFSPLSSFFCPGRLHSPSSPSSPIATIIIDSSQSRHFSCFPSLELRSTNRRITSVLSESHRSFNGDHPTFSSPIPHVTSSAAYFRTKDARITAKQFLCVCLNFILSRVRASSQGLRDVGRNRQTRTSQVRNRPQGRQGCVRYRLEGDGPTAAKGRGSSLISVLLALAGFDGSVVHTNYFISHLADRRREKDF